MSDHSVSYSDDEETFSERINLQHVLHMSALAACEAAEYFTKYMIKEPVRTSTYTGYRFMKDILEGHDIRCHQLFRVDKRVFRLLCHTLNNYGLTPTKHVTLEEMIGIFLMTIGHSEGNRMMQERFQRSGETISRIFHMVLDCVCKLAIDSLKPTSDNFTRLHDHIKEDNRYMPYFRDCVGEIDGTHISCVVSSNYNTPYINRKGRKTQNVMVVCDWDMCFTFVWAGWEGSAHDTRIFHGALSWGELNSPHHPEGKYYLVDAGYSMIKGYIAPYPRERHHIPEFKKNRTFRSPSDCFNYHHASLRGIVERTFGVWKERFHILDLMPSYKFETQVKIVCASMTIHNFIRKNAKVDYDLINYDHAQSQATQSSSPPPATRTSSIHFGVSTQVSREMVIQRDSIRELYATKYFH